MKKIAKFFLSLVMIFVLAAPTMVSASLRRMIDVSVVPVMDAERAEVGDVVEFAVVLSSGGGNNLSALALEFSILNELNLIDFSLAPNISAILGMPLFGIVHTGDPAALKITAAMGSGHNAVIDELIIATFTCIVMVDGWHEIGFLTADFAGGMFGFEPIQTSTNHANVLRRHGTVLNLNFVASESPVLVFDDVVVLNLDSELNNYDDDNSLTDEEILDEYTDESKIENEETEDASETPEDDYESMYDYEVPYVS